MAVTETEKAIAAAEKLLKDVLTTQGWEDYIKTKKVAIFAKGKSGREYKISTVGNGVYEWKHGQAVISHCIAFRDAYSVLPHDYRERDILVYRLDNAIATKLLIECDEETFLRVSGHHGVFT